MKHTKRIHTIVGARPQFIKAAALSRAIAADGRFEERIIHTGQHYDANMSDVFFDGLNIPKPAHRLEFGGLSHGAMTGRMIEALETIFQEEKPDAVLIYGDTNSTLAGAVAASKLHIPVVHVEAGLRSFNMRMPEEINRVLADRISALLLCPTHLAVKNLQTEGVTDGVHMVGDVMHDATLHAIEMTKGRDNLRRELGLNGSYAVCTLHRAENTDDEARFHRVLDFLESEAKKQPIVLPLHPRTKSVMERIGRKPNGVILIDPLDYFELAELMSAADLVLTDSGGLQKEAYFHRVPCITMRDETEWVETIETGWNRLWTEPVWNIPRHAIEEYGDGHAAEHCVSIIADFLVA